MRDRRRIERALPDRRGCAMNELTFPFEIKSLDDAGLIEGVISAFDGMDSYGDTVQKGAYAKSLASIQSSGRKLPLLYQHDPHRPIGVWNELRETPSALVGKAELALDVRDGQEAYSLAKRGALTGISIGFSIPPGGYRREKDRRVLTEIDLWEASLVTFPADQAARVQRVKAIQGARDIEALLCEEGGMSSRKAKAAAAAAWKAINASDTESDAEAELIDLLQASTRRIAAGN
jgi:HK97 family phage prohead protease